MECINLKYVSSIWNDNKVLIKQQLCGKDCCFIWLLKRKPKSLNKIKWKECGMKGRHSFFYVHKKWWERNNHRIHIFSY